VISSSPVISGVVVSGAAMIPGAGMAGAVIFSDRHRTCGRGCGWVVGGRKRPKMMTFGNPVCAGQRVCASAQVELWIRYGSLEINCAVRAQVTHKSRTSPLTCGYANPQVTHNLAQVTPPAVLSVARNPLRPFRAGRLRSAGQRAGCAGRGRTRSVTRDRTRSVTSACRYTPRRRRPGTAGDLCRDRCRDHCRVVDQALESPLRPGGGSRVSQAGLPPAGPPWAILGPGNGMIIGGWTTPAGAHRGVRRCGPAGRGSVWRASARGPGSHRRGTHRPGSRWPGVITHPRARLRWRARTQARA
jgi:hypothetical protein